MKQSRIRSGILVGASSALFVLIVVATSPAHASNGSIDIFGDRAGTVCEKTLGMIDSIYVMARLEGATVSGISEACFRIEGLPSEWRAIASEGNPHSIFWVGSPFAVSGTLIAFHCEEAEANGLVLLFAVCIYVPPTAPIVHDVRLTVREYPFSPTTTTPLLFICNAPDPPGYLAFGALGGEFILNPQGSSCTIGVESATWSAVKRLYGTR